MPRLADIRLRRSTASTWSTTNPVLEAGEPGYETDTNKVKVGTGTTWNLTPYAAVGSADTATKWAGRALFVQTTAPTTGMVAGDIWIKN